MNHRFETYNTIETDQNGQTTEISFNGKHVPGIHPHTLVSGLDLVSKYGVYLNGTYSFYDAVYLNNSNAISDNAYQLVDVKIGFKNSLNTNCYLDVFVGGNNL